MSWYNPDDAVTVAPEGWHPATIESSEMKTTKRGAPMEVVAFRIYTPKREIVLCDYFHPDNVWKLKKLAIALDQLGVFESGDFITTNFRGKPLEVELKIEDSDQYGEQNKIKAFASDGTNTGGVAGASMSSPAPAASGASNNGTPMDHDEIPF